MKDDAPQILRWGFTVVAIALLVAQFCVHGSVDIYTLPLLLFAMIPWLDLESFSAAGVKAVFRKQAKLAEKSIKEAGIPAPSEIPEDDQASSDDSAVYMLLLRAQIEDKLRKLCDKHGVKFIHGAVPTTAGLLYSLEEKGAVDRDVSAAVLEVVALFSQAVHGIKLKQSTVNSAIKSGVAIIQWLDGQLSE